MDLTISGRDELAERNDADLAGHIEITGPESVAASAFDVDGEPVSAWSDLSGVFAAQGGRHLQIHCNFAHHRDGVVARLGCAADRESVAAAIAEWDAFDLESELIADGMIGAAIRTLDEWDAHPHAIATSDLPLMSAERIADAPPPSPKSLHPSRTDTTTDTTLAGLKVLDCSRVLAGPVAGRTLAGFGADVLRVGADHLPSVQACVIATGFGKRNTSIDLRTDGGRRAMEAVIAEADVWIDAYRPGAFDSHGFTPERIAEIRPGIVIVQVCAFDWVGPWTGRRGFDSIVQSTTGVRWAGGQFARDADPSLLESVDCDFGRLTTVRPFAGSSNAAPTLLGSSPPLWRDRAVGGGRS